MLRRAVESVPDQAAVIEPEGRTLTYAELGDEAQRTATALRSLGLEPHDRVLVMLDQTADTVVFWLGANIASVTFVPINTAYKGEMLSYIIEHAQAEVLVIEGKWCDRVVDIAEDLTTLKTVIVRGEENATLSTKFLRRDFTELLALDPIDVGEPFVWDVSAIVYTSGTEGRPKGVLMPHGLAYMASYAYMKNHTDTEVVIATLPIFHGGGLHTSVLHPIRVAGTMVLLESFSASRFWEYARRYKCTVALIVGPMAAMLMQQPPQPDDRDNDMKNVIMFPAIPEAAEFAERFGVEVGVGYGQTEHAASLMCPPGQARPGMCGYPTGIFETRIVDAWDMPVHHGEVGELVLRSKDSWTLMSGYFNAPEATAATWRNLWYHTGDMFRIDECGQWVFVDRRKDVLRRRGENVSSIEVERELLRVPGIVEAAVVAVPSELGEDDIKAVFVLDPDVPFCYTDTLRELYRRLPHFMVPRYYEVLDALPKTHSMRIQKATLRAQGTSSGDVWDCEAEGFRITRKALIEPSQPPS
jgi:crotonobetaine/carnitine-CoA ligase